MAAHDVLYMFPPAPKKGRGGDDCIARNDWAELQMAMDAEQQKKTSDNLLARLRAIAERAKNSETA